MPDILVKNLDPKIVNRLRIIAKSRGRSLENEIKTILAEAARLGVTRMMATITAKWQKNFLNVN